MKNLNKKELNRQISEKEWTLILLRYLNNKGYDYVINKHSIQPANWVDVDVFAISDSNTHPPLYIQLCLDVDPKNAGYEESKELKAHTFNNCGDEFRAIEGKLEKYIKQEKNFSQITLAVQSIGSYFIEDDENHKIKSLKQKCEALKKRHGNIGFLKDIYLLSRKGEICDGQTIQEDPERVFQII